MPPAPHSAFTRPKFLARRVFWKLVLVGFLSSTLWAQGGPPLLTDDPGTPGNHNWEINLASTQNFVHNQRTYETPILDLNYGAGDRVQLKYEVPYLLISTDGGPHAAALGNSLAGVKWRFYENEKKGWNILNLSSVGVQ